MTIVKLLALVTVFQLKCICVSVSTKSENLVLGAINSLLLEYFVNASAKVDLISYGISDKLIDEMLRNKPETISVQVSKGGRNFQWNNQLNISSIAVFDSAQNFKETVKNMKWLSNPRMRHKHLVYAPGLSVSDIVENIKNGFDIDQVGFLMNETKKSIELVASFMFTPQKCRSNQLVTINRFMRNTMKWENTNFYPRKYRNFHSCRLNVALLAIDKQEEMFTIPIAESFNHRIRYFFVETRMDTLKDTEYDSIQYSQTFDGDNQWITSTVYLTVPLRYLIPPGESYTIFEKMFLMFEYELWIAILITLLIGFITIQIINLTSNEVQDFVFGQGVRTPTINMLSIFLCGAQHRAPGRNFSRFFLILFIVWSLIIRTCYQSTLFKFLQADLRKPTAKTVEELFEKGFKFFADPLANEDKM